MLPPFLMAAVPLLFFPKAAMADYRTEWFEPAKAAWNAETTQLYPYNFDWWTYQWPATADHTVGSPPDDPIDPHDWMEMAGAGMSMKIDLAGNPNGSSKYVYTDEVIQAWKDQGFRAGRIHVDPIAIWDLGADADGYILKQESLADLKSTLQRFVDHNMPVLISLSGGSNGEPGWLTSYADTVNFRDGNFKRICDWYRQFAELLKDMSHLVAFESFVEYHGFDGVDAEHKLATKLPNNEVRYPDFVNNKGLAIDNWAYIPGLNNLYVQLSSVIRETNPTRIFCFRPPGQGRGAMPKVTPWRYGTEGDPNNLAGAGKPYWVLSVGGSANIKTDWVIGTRTNDEALIEAAEWNTWKPAVHFYTSTRLPVWISLWGVKEDSGTLSPPMTIDENVGYVQWYIESTQTKATKANGERVRIPNGFQQSWWLWDFTNNVWQTNGQSNIDDPIAILDVLSEGAWGLDLVPKDWPPKFILDLITKSDVAVGVPYTSTLVGDVAYDKGDAVTYSKISGPAWLDVTAGGILSGTPPTEALGINTFAIGASSTLGSHQSILSFLVVDAIVESFVVVADAHVQKNRGDTNYGSSNALVIRNFDNSFSRQPYLKFNVNGIGSEISKVSLRVYCNTEDDIVSVFGVDDSNWNEMEITWNTAPPRGLLLDSKQASAGEWIELDVTSYVTGNGVYSFALDEDGGDSGETIGSREDGYGALLDVKLVPNSPTGETSSPSMSPTPQVSRVALKIYALQF